MAAGDYLGALERGADGLRVGILVEGFDGTDASADVEARVREAAESLDGLGCGVEEVNLPAHRDLAALTLPLLLEGSFRTLGQDGVTPPPADYPPEFMERVRGWRASADRMAPGPTVFGLVGALVHRRRGLHFYAKATRYARHLRGLLRRCAVTRRRAAHADGAPTWRRRSRPRTRACSSASARRSPPGATRRSSTRRTTRRSRFPAARSTGCR